MEPENTFHLKKNLSPPSDRRHQWKKAPGARTGTPARLDAKGAASPFPCQEFTTTLKTKKSRADSLKSQRHPALEDKFDHCIT